MKRTVQFLLLIGAFAALCLLLPTTPTLGKACHVQTDEPYDIPLWLYSDPDMMNTIHEDPSSDEQVQQKTWTYGLDTVGEALHGDFQLHDNIPSTMEEGVILWLEVQNPSVSNNAQVSFELKVNGETIAETSEELSSGFPNGENRDYWELEFVGEASGQKVYTIEEGSVITLEMSADNPVQIHYGNSPDDDYYLLFTGIQFQELDICFFRHYKDEEPVEIRSESSSNNENSFHPNEIAENARVHINGSVLNVLGNYDFREAAVEIYFDGERLEDPGNGLATLNPVDDGDRYFMEFSYSWDYADQAALQDGTYTMKLTLKDQMARDEDYYKFGEGEFRMSNFGTYFDLAEGEKREKSVARGDKLEFRLLDYNTGLEEDDFDLECFEPSGWEAQFLDDGDEVEEVTVEASATEEEPLFARLTLELEVPEDEEQGRYHVAFQSSSQGSGEVNRISHLNNVWVTVTTHPVYSVSFSRDKEEREKNTTSEAGKEEKTILYLNNDGQEEDSFLLDLDEHEGWEFWLEDPETGEKLETNKLTLQAESQEELELVALCHQNFTAANQLSQRVTMSSENGTGPSRIVKLNIRGRMPVLSIETVVPLLPNEGQEVSFFCDVIYSDPVEYYLWESDLDGFLANTSSLNTTLPGLSPGAHIISVTAVTASGCQSRALGYLLQVNARPQCGITDISPFDVAEGKAVRLKAWSEDDGEVLLYRWQSSKGGEFYNGSEREIELDSFGWGQHEISLQAMDDSGFWSETDTGELYVNQRPALLFTSPGPSELVVDDSVLISWVDLDGDDDATITLFYRPVPGDDGKEQVMVEIASGISEDDQEDSYLWDTSMIPDGQYHILAWIDDGVSEIEEECPGTVRIEHQGDGNGEEPGDGDDELPGFGLALTMLAFLIPATRRKKAALG